MTQKYILTGGPGSGKSSVLLELERRGEYIIREAAEDVIKLAQSKGVEKPWELANFQRDILNIQIQRERAIPQDIRRVFIDRGIPDGLAYTKQGTDIYKEIKSQCPRYSGIFLIENLGGTEQNKVRREDNGEALELELILGEIYTINPVGGYKVVHIPPQSVIERADDILGVIEGGIFLR